MAVNVVRVRFLRMRTCQPLVIVRPQGARVVKLRQEPWPLRGAPKDALDKCNHIIPTWKYPFVFCERAYPELLNVWYSL